MTFEHDLGLNTNLLENGTGIQIRVKSYFNSKVLVTEVVSG